MGKQDIVDVIQHGANLESKAAAEKAMEAIIAAVTEELAAGNDVLLRGFGTFKVKKVASRKGRDFATGKSLTIPGGSVVRFEPGAELRESVRSGRPASFLAGMESRIGELRKSLDGMTSTDYYKDGVEKLRSSYEEARYKLTLLQNASGDAWQDLRQGFDVAFRQLRATFGKARARF